jgi:hypothetical protein
MGGDRVLNCIEYRLSKKYRPSCEDLFDQSASTSTFLLPKAPSAVLRGVPFAIPKKNGQADPKLRSFGNGHKKSGRRRCGPGINVPGPLFVVFVPAIRVGAWIRAERGSDNVLVEIIEIDNGRYFKEV